MAGRLQAFATTEFQQRVAATRAAMKRSGLDVLLVHAPENIYYLTGYQTSGYFAYQTLCVTADGAVPILLLRYLEKGNVDEYSWLENCETWREGEDVVQRTVDVLRTVRGATSVIGIEKQSWFLTVDVAEKLHRALPGAQWRDASQLVDRIRLVKSGAELDYIRRAGLIAEAEMRAAIQMMRPGVTEAEIAATVLNQGVLAGCEYTGLPHHIMSGHRYNVCHANWTSKPLAAGELVLLELYGCVERYHAAQVRTISVGKPSDDAREAAELVVKAQEEALKALRPAPRANRSTRWCAGPSARSVPTISTAPAIRQASAFRRAPRNGRRWISTSRRIGRYSKRAWRSTCSPSPAASASAKRSSLPKAAPNA